jgi:hypothetical protein
LNKPALYILVNRDAKKLYVGETDDSIKRLRNHEAKDFWTEAIVFHSTTDTLSTTEVKWLEAKTYEALKELGYYDLSENKQVPQQPPLKRNQIYTLEPIFEEAKNYICAAGFDIFLKKKAEEEPQPQEPVKNEVALQNNVWLLPSSRKRFDLGTKTFGPRELVFRADTLDMSTTLPRVSPDGRYLMFTMGKYGVFHIWHKDADLYMLDLANGKVRCMDEINSPDVESYHSWSSNGRWVVFSSRRDDGNFTRPFIAHIDKNGHGGKPFELPCADPDYHRQFMKSYNIPELMKGAVKITPQSFADALKKDGEQVKYVQHLNK